MIIGIKDFLKFMGISVIVFCAVFVCAIFLNYNMDVAGIGDQIAAGPGRIVYDALVMTGKVVAAVSGGCLAATSLVMLIGYIKNFIDAHTKELGILKALGYTNLQIARHFWVFGLCVLIGGVLGFAGAFCYMPAFYDKQNAQGFLPDVAIHFHPALAVCLILVPTLLFALLSVGYAAHRLKRPVLSLLRETTESRPAGRRRKETKDQPFLQDLKQNTRRDRKLLVFLIAFSAFCFSAMTQMSMSMKDLSSEQFFALILVIGLILAFLTLFLSLSSVVRANGKTIAMMKVFGYSQRECSRAILGCYRVVSYIGFAVGTAYQYLLLKLVVTLVFADYEGIPEYKFNLPCFFVSLALFLATYELIMHVYAKQISRTSLRSVMLEN